MKNTIKLLFFATLFIFSCSKEDYELLDQGETSIDNIQEDSVISNTNSESENTSISVAETSEILNNATVNTVEEIGLSSTNKKEIFTKNSGEVTKSFNPFGFPQGGGCDDWTAPWANIQLDDGKLLDVYYDSNEVSLDNINCVRKFFFEMYPNLRLVLIEPGNPYHDIWYIISDGTGTGGSASNVEQSLNDDPRSCARNPCD